MDAGWALNPSVNLSFPKSLFSLQKLINNVILCGLTVHFWENQLLFQSRFLKKEHCDHLGGDGRSPQWGDSSKPCTNAAVEEMGLKPPSEGWGKVQQEVWGRAIHLGGCFWLPLCSLGLAATWNGCWMGGEH